MVRDNFVGSMTCPGPSVTLGEWVYFVLSVDLAKGRAEIVSSSAHDGSTDVETFNTLYSPNAVDKVNACPSGAGTAGGGFVGLLDEVRVWPEAKGALATAAVMREAAPAGVTAKAQFDAAELAAAAAAAPGGVSNPKTVGSTGPWHPSVVYAVKPDTLKVQQGATVEVLATNLAPSRWLRVNTGAGQVTPTDTSEYGALAPSTDLFCGGGE